MITEDDKIADVLKQYPGLKEQLLKRSPKFSNLNNPIIFRTVGQFARIKDIAKNTGEDLAEFLDFLNKHKD